MKLFFILVFALYGQSGTGQVYDIKQTITGNIFFASANGFFRYNNANHLPLLSKNQIKTYGIEDGRSIFQLDENNFLLGSTNGLFQYKNNVLKKLTPFSTHKIMKHGTDFLLVSQKGLILFDLNQKKVKQHILKNEYLVNIETSAEHIYVSGKVGLIQLDHKLKHSKVIFDSFVTSMTMDSAGNVWFGTIDSKLFKYNEISGKIIEIKEINGISLSDSGVIYHILYSHAYKKIFVSSYLKSVLVVDLKTDKARFLDDTHETLFSFIDILGNRYHANFNEIKMFKNEQNRVWYSGKGKNVTALKKIENTLFIGTKANGVYLSQNGLINDSLKDSRVGGYILNLNQSGNSLFIGTMNGLFELNNKTLKLFPLNFKAKTNFVSSVYTDRKKRIWVSNPYDGINVFTKNKRLIKKINTQVNRDLPTSTIGEIIEDHRSNFWFSTFHKGLIYYNESENKLISYPYLGGKEGTNNRAIQDLEIDSEGNLWIGYVKNGFSRFDGQTFKHYKHILDENIYSLTSDKEGDLWVTSTSSLYLFSNEQLYKFPHNSSYGMYNYNTVLLDNDTLIYGLTNGIMKFNLVNLKRKIKRNKILFLSGSLNSNEVNVTDTLRYFSFLNSLRLSFKSLYDTDQSKFFYKKDDENWVELDNGVLYLKENIFNSLKLTLKIIDADGFVSERSLHVTHRVHILYYLFLIIIPMALWFRRKYSRSLILKVSKIIDEKRKKEIYQKIIFTLKEKEYHMENDVNIQLFSKRINESSRYVSLVVNEVERKTFRELINEYRVKSVIKKFSDDSYNGKSIIEIAESCGFNSPSTFNNAFKKVTEKTPSQYRKDLFIKN